MNFLRLALAAIWLFYGHTTFAAGCDQYDQEACGAGEQFLSSPANRPPYDTDEGNCTCHHDTGSCGDQFGNPEGFSEQVSCSCSLSASSCQATGKTFDSANCQCVGPSPTSTPDCSISCETLFATSGNNSYCDDQIGSQGCFESTSTGSWSDPDGTNRCRCRQLSGDLDMNCTPSYKTGSCSETQCETNPTGVCSASSTTSGPGGGGSNGGGNGGGNGGVNGGANGGNNGGGNGGGNGGVNAGPTPVNCPPGSLPESATNCLCKIKGQIYDPVANTCSCPTNYEPVVVDQATTAVECRPKPGSEFYRNNTTLSNNFPVCGAGRVPVDASGNVLKVATDSIPNSSQKKTSPQGFDFLYAIGTGSAPQYLYQSATRCECTWKDFKKTGAASSDTTTASTSVGGKPRFEATDYNTINGQDDAQSQTYGPVAIASDETQNGRLGSIFSTGSSVCGCPNINETMVSDGDSDPYPASGHCAPMIEPGPYRVLTTFDPTIYDTTADSQVIDRSSEVIRKSGGVMEKIVLPSSPGSSSTTTYQRKIWACAPPMTIQMNGADSVCAFDPARNACDNGAGGGPPSEVSGNISGTTAQERFNNTINKKLACCLNEFGAMSSFVKFDCVENDVGQYKNFDELWSSADTATEGGQLNAILLTNAQGRWLSGFYTLSGSRCEGFSEFAGTIQPGVVDPVSGVGAQMNRVGGSGFDTKSRAPIPLPGSGVGGGSSAYSAMSAGITGQLKQTIPTTVEDRRRCPILVRAAIAAQCPSGGDTPPATYEGPPRQCSAAKDIFVHIRVEQVWEIAGQPSMMPFDTVMSRASAADISIDRIIANKYGNQCPPGQTPGSTGGGCHY